MQITHRTGRGRRNCGGFTLIEIMIVVLIIGVLLNIAAPSFIHARDVAQANVCISNLHNINSAKEQWALEDNEIPTAIPQWTDIQPYMHNSVAPVCPSGGTYSYNSIDQVPTCSYGKAYNAPAHSF